MYAMRLGGGIAFQADTDNPQHSSSFDTQLFLFDSGGALVTSNDDTFSPVCANLLGGLNRCSRISFTPLVTEVFYLAISAFNRDPILTGGVLSGWGGNASLGQPFVSPNYQIDVRNALTAAVPEPISLALLGAGLAGLGFARKYAK